MKYVLAPLAGFTDAPFRRLCFEGGADLAYTEMVSAAGLAHGSSPTRHLMETMEGEGPVACQLFGASESDVAFATGEIDKVAVRPPTSNLQPRFTEVNLNAGCPMTKVTREGAGAKLVEDPEKIYRLLTAMKENTSLPVTLKTRLGPHPGNVNAFEILDAAERAGVAGVTFHARFTSQMHGGTVHLDLLRELVARARVPITGNGSVTDAKSAAAMAATGVSAIMIGRAALANPGIFGVLKSLQGREVKVKGREEGQGERSRSTEDDKFHCLTSGLGPLTSSSPSTSLLRLHLKYLLSFRDQLASRFPNDHIPSPDAFASVKMHVHLFRYFNGRLGAAALRARLNAVRTLAEIDAIVREMGN